MAELTYTKVGDYYISDRDFVFRDTEIRERQMERREMGKGDKGRKEE